MNTKQTVRRVGVLGCLHRYAKLSSVNRFQLIQFGTGFSVNTLYVCMHALCQCGRSRAKWVIKLSVPVALIQDKWWWWAGHVEVLKTKGSGDAIQEAICLTGWRPDLLRVDCCILVLCMWGECLRRRDTAVVVALTSRHLA